MIFLLLFWLQEALDWAMRNQLWGHALFLSSKMDSRTYSWVLTGWVGMARGQLSGDWFCWAQLAIEVSLIAFMVAMLQSKNNAQVLVKPFMLRYFVSQLNRHAGEPVQIWLVSSGMHASSLARKTNLVARKQGEATPRGSEMWDGVT